MRLTVLALTVLAIGVAGPTSIARAGPVAPLPAICGTHVAAPTWEHVVWIWFENHGYGQIVGSPDAPFMNRTLARTCGLATNYHALAHPSLPNYIAATSGLAGDGLAPFRDDCNARGPCRIAAPNLFEQVGSWSAYAESMRKPCTHFCTGPYAASHNPAAYYTTLHDCSLRDVGLGALRADLATDSLASFSFVTPNMCHSMHNCSVRTGDAWLRRIVRLLTASSAYQRGTMAIAITFDESDGGDNHVATFVVAPSTVPGTRAGEPFTHYSLLRTTEEMLGLPPLGRARGAQSMRAAFNL
jgi:phospholipase C